MATNNGIKSKDRVQAHGEVFTPDSIVMDMIKLVDDELMKEPEVEALSEEGKLWYYIDSTVLEPTCGDGQFLIRLLYKKLEAVSKLPVEQRELAALHAVCSIYGVDIQEDNVVEARERMYNIFIGNEVETFDNKEPRTFSISFKDLGIDISEKLRKAVRFVLDANIVVGNTLVTECDGLYDKTTLPENKPVFFNSWKFSDNKVKAVFEFLHEGKALPLYLDTQSKEVDFLNIDTVWDGYINPIEKLNNSDELEGQESDEDVWDF